MTRKAFILVPLALLLVVGVTWTGIGADDTDHGEGWHSHISAFLHGVHGAHGVHHGSHSIHGGPHGAIAELIRDLDLTDDQRESLGVIHGVLMEHVVNQSAHGGHFAVHLGQLAGRIESTDPLDPTETHRLIDHHVEEMRRMAYAVSDETVALLNSLDDRQRVILAEHLRDAQIHLEDRRSMAAEY